MKVARALDYYLAEHAAKNCVDLRRQENACKHLSAFFGKYDLAEIDVPLSREYATARYSGRIGAKKGDRRGSPSTVRRELTVLVAASNFANWMKQTTQTVSVDMPVERLIGADNEAAFLSKTELDALFAQAASVDEEFGAFVRLLYYSGARRRSIENLTRLQVKLDEKRIHLMPPGKRATRKRQPIIPLLSTMRADIEFLLGRDTGTLLFKSRDFYAQFRACAEAAGIPEGKRHPHVLRHTRATHLLQAGKSIYDVAKLLGDTIATVERVYGHHSNEYLMDRLNA